MKTHATGMIDTGDCPNTSDALDAIGDAAKEMIEEPKSEKKSAPSHTRRTGQVPIDLLDAGPNARELDELRIEALCESIQRDGLNDPIRIMPGKGGRFVIVPWNGRHRVEAYQRLCLEKIPAIVDTGDQSDIINTAIRGEMKFGNPNAWEQFSEIRRRRAEFDPAVSEAQMKVEIARATCITPLTVSKCVDILDHVTPELYVHLENDPSDETLEHLYWTRKIGWDSVYGERREKQLAYWEEMTRRKWRRKRIREKGRVRPEKKCNVRRQIVRIKPDSLVHGERVRHMLARAIGDRDADESVRLAPGPQKQARRAISTQVLEALKNVRNK